MEQFSEHYNERSQLWLVAVALALKQKQKNVENVIQSGVKLDFLNVGHLIMKLKLERGTSITTFKWDNKTYFRLFNRIIKLIKLYNFLLRVV